MRVVSSCYVDRRFIFSRMALKRASEYERLGVVLINAIKEQQAQIDELRRLVSTLEQQNKALSNQLLQLGQRAQ